VAGITSSSSLSEEELLAVLAEARAFLGVFAAGACVVVAAGPAGLRLGSTKIRGGLITWLAGSSSSLLSEEPSVFFSGGAGARGLLLAALELPSFWAGVAGLAFCGAGVSTRAVEASAETGAPGTPFIREALVGGSFTAGFTWAGASSSLSDSSSLLLSEAASGFPARGAVASVFSGGAAAAPFLENPLPGAEAVLTWGVFPEG